MSVHTSGCPIFKLTIKLYQFKFKFPRISNSLNYDINNTRMVTLQSIVLLVYRNLNLRMNTVMIFKFLFSI